MFARAVSIKMDQVEEFKLPSILEREVVSRFGQENDFLGLLAFVRTDGTEALSLSLWDKEKGPEANWPADLGELTTLAGVVRGIPSAQVYRVSDSTLNSMKDMLGQGEGAEATSDLEVYHSCATGFPMVARTVHAELRFPASAAPLESIHQEDPVRQRQ